MPCLREVFLPWQLLFDTHDAVGTIAIGYARDFFLFHFFWYAIRQKMAGFVDSFTLEWNVCVKYLVIPRKNGKKCKECPKFIVRRVNKLISVDPCHSIVLSFIFFPFLWSFSFFNRVPWMFSLLLSSNQMYVRLSKRIRYELQCN